MSDETIIGTGISAISIVEKYNDLFSQGDLCFWKCEYEKAKEHFQAVLNQPSISLLDSVRCYNSLGAVNAKLKNYQEALNSYHKQLDLLLQLETSEKKDNDIAKCKMSIGKIYWLKQDYARAIEYYNKVLASVPTVTLDSDLTSNIHKDLANLYTKTRQFGLALVHFKKALNIDRHQLGEDHPKLGQTYANMGVMYYSQQDYKQALNYFEQALKTWRKSLLPTHVYIESMEKTIRTVQSKIATVQSELVPIHLHTNTATDGNRMRLIYSSIMALKNMGPTSNEPIKFIYETSPWDDDDDDDTPEPTGDIIITGRLLPNSDIYRQGSIKTEIILGTSFPFKPPKVMLKTEVYHPNVAKNGEVCLRLLDPNGTWTAITSLRTVVQEVTKLIDEPSIDGIQHTEAASLWDTNRDEYKQKATAIFNNNRSPRD